MEEISSKFCKFFKCEKLVLQVSWKYQVSKWKCVQESSSIHWKFEVCGRRLFELLKVSSFKCVKESFSHCCKFQVKFQPCVNLMVAIFTFGSSKSTWCFPNIGFGNLLMGVLPYQVKKLQGPITTKKRPMLLHCFVNISRMPNLHTFNIVTMWKMRNRLFVVCMKLRPLATNCSFKGDFSPSKCKKEMTCLCTSTWWKPSRTNYVPSRWTLQMKLFTLYSSWAFLHPLII